MSKLVFWHILRSQDMMKEYEEKNFKDHPTISSEYVKFLTANSGGEIVDTLLSRIKDLEQENSGLKKDVAKATASANAASNLVDELKKKYDKIDNRLSKVESNKK